MQVFQGKSASGGVAIGKIFLYQKGEQQVKRLHVEDTEAELARLREAAKEAAEQLQKLYETSVKSIGESGAAIFEVHRMMLEDEGFDAVFIGSGAGLPRFMGIEGENLNGVVSANEFLTRANLMHAYDEVYDTPIYVGKRVVVVGGGNVAMDAVRTAKRLGAEATIVYRRSEAELPARREEVHHAKEEGIEFRMLTNPTRVLGNDKGWVRGISCVRMTLGEPDESGRRSPVVIEGSDFDIDCDVVIMALGTSPNPLLKRTTAGLETNRRGCIVTDESGATSRRGVFAGGDAVTGAATVILAMGAGRRAARAIDEYVRGKQTEA